MDKGVYKVITNTFLMMVVAILIVLPLTVLTLVGVGTLIHFLKS